VNTSRDPYGYAHRSPLNFTDPSGLYSADSAEHYAGNGYTMVNAPWCEGGFGFMRADDSNWRQLNPVDMATYAYVHTQQLVDEGQLPVTTGDRLAPSIWETAAEMLDPVTSPVADFVSKCISRMLKSAM
jgi:hypothetical protein